MELTNLRASRICSELQKKIFRIFCASGSPSKASIKVSIIFFNEVHTCIIQSVLILYTHSKLFFIQDTK